MKFHTRQPMTSFYIRLRGNLAEAHYLKGEYDQAFTHFKFAISEIRLLGLLGHPISTKTVAAYALTLIKQQRIRDARRVLVEFKESFLDRLGQQERSSYRNTKYEKLIVNSALKELVMGTEAASKISDEDPYKFASLGFEFGQLASIRSAGGAIEKITARFVSRDDKAGDLFRARQDLIRKLRNIDRRFTSKISNLNSKPQSSEPDIGAGKPSDDLIKKLNKVDGALAARFPRFQPLSVRDP